VTEWLIVTVLKTVVPQGTGGSNPSCSVLRSATNGRPPEVENMYYVYILKMADGEYYIGSTNNLKRRTEEHTAGREISTKWRLPATLEAYIAVKSKQTSHRLEKYLKTSSGKATLRKRILPDEAIA
jgi:putative endonuclease